MTTHEQHDLQDREDLGDLDNEVASPVAEEPPIEDESTAVTREPVPAVNEHESSPDTGLFADSDVADLRSRWAGVQAAFVDDPKDCVQQADHLVSDLVEQLTTVFAQARSRLEEEWSQGRDASTEDLRMALMHYREFFDRLLGV
jgi:hypothetical protein